MSLGYLPRSVVLPNMVVYRINANSWDIASGMYSSSDSEGLVIEKNTVTQATNINTGVEINSYAGVITTVSASTAGEATDTFQVTNNKCNSASLILGNVVGYNAALDNDGFPKCSVDNIADGYFNIVLYNTDNNNSLDGVVRIGFLILNN